MILFGKSVLITGGRGLLGTAVSARLLQLGNIRVETVASEDHDLTDGAEANLVVHELAPDLVIHCAGRVGGIEANGADPYRFGRENLLLGMNVLDACITAPKRPALLICGSTCSYPAECPVPFKESSLWDGEPDLSNRPYGSAKRELLTLLQAALRGGKLAQAAYVIPANLYGPGDNFSQSSSHVIPAMIRRFSDAVRYGINPVTCWGTGRATRDFLHVRDAAEGIVSLCVHSGWCEAWNTGEPVNFGTGREVSMEYLAELIARMCGYRGEIMWDASRPDGQKRRALDWSLAKETLGWHPTIGLEDGIRELVEWWEGNRE